MFLKNERGMGVKNGSLGIVQNVTIARMAVMLDDGRAVAFDLKDYAQIGHIDDHEFQQHIDIERMAGPDRASAREFLLAIAFHALSVSCRGFPPGIVERE